MNELTNQTKSSPEKVRVFSSTSPEYHAAFRTFLACTDQKEKAMAHLDHEVALLSRRKTFLDVGAGTGKLTAHLAPKFEETIAVEPNPSLVPDLRANCPGILILENLLRDAEVEGEADFVLCSHVFYYLPRAIWLESLEKMAAWLAVDGVLEVALQNADTDCMRMLDHFLGERFDLSALATKFSAQTSNRLTVSLTTVPATIRTVSLNDACAVAEFMLNLVPITEPPPYRALTDYVQTHFRRSGAFEFTCNQDFLRVQRLPGA